MIQTTDALRTLTETMDADEIAERSAPRSRIKDIRALSAASAAETTRGGIDFSTGLAADRGIGRLADPTPRARIESMTVVESKVATTPVIAPRRPLMADVIEDDDAIAADFDHTVEDPAAVTPHTEPTPAPAASQPVAEQSVAAADVSHLIISGVNFRSPHPMRPGTVWPVEVDQPVGRDGTRPIRFAARVRVGACRLRSDGQYDVSATVA